MLYHSETFGNPSSRDHRWGWDAAAAVDEARAHVANLAGFGLNQVVFASGTTEALNTVVRSYAGFEGWTCKKLVVCTTEHDAVLFPARCLTKRTGIITEMLSVDRLGHIDLEMLRWALSGTNNPLVALMAANNEIGTRHPVREIAEITHHADGLFLCDTTQTFGKVDVRDAGMDFATISGHKIHGPKGIGALLVASERAEQSLEPLILGGGQERGLRGGTLNVPAIVGLGEACRLLTEECEDDVERMTRLRDHLEEGIITQVPHTWVNGDRANRLCNTSNIGFKGIDARTMIRDMHDIAVSTRSACSSGNSGPSHVLKAIGLSDEDAYSCIRFSLGRFTTQEEIDYTIGKVVASAHKLRRSKSA